MFPSSGNNFVIFNNKILTYVVFKRDLSNQPIESTLIKSRKPTDYWKNEENINLFLDSLKDTYNLRNFDDWNSLSQQQILTQGGRNVLKYHSMYEIRCKGFPEGKNKFIQPKSKNPVGYWQNEENIKNFLLKLSKKLNLKDEKDWKLITQKQIKENNGSRLLKFYSMDEIKSLGYPKGKFLPQKKPISYWENKENIKKFLLKLSNKLNIKTIKDWDEKLTRKEINLNGGCLLKNYSLYELKCIAYPDGKLLFSNSTFTIKYWENFDNVTRFLLELKEKLNLSTAKDWNKKLTQKQIISHGGRNLFHLYSIYELKCIGYPDGKEIYSKPKKLQGFWNNIENVQKFLFDFGKKFNLSTPEDWNSISAPQIREFGGRNLLNLFSMFELKVIACPGGESYFREPKRAQGYWDNEENIQHFFNELGNKLQIKVNEDWLRVSREQIIYHGGGGLVARYNKDYLVHKFIPGLSKAKSKLSGRSSQRWLFLQIQKLFPGEEIVEDYFHSEISRLTGYSVQFDIFLVDKKIAFEYHGQQHYQDLPQIFGPIEMFTSRDSEKQKLCTVFGIKLIIIPHWWDKTLNTLKETIDSEM